jgi:hypothetical protein
VYSDKNRIYCKFQRIDDHIIKILNQVPDQNEPQFVLGPFNSTKEARDFVKNSDQLYTYMPAQINFYEKDDFIFSDNLLDVYKHLYRRIISKLIVKKYLTSKSALMFLVYFYSLYLLNKDNYLVDYTNFENDYYDIITSNDPTKIDLLSIFSSVRKNEHLLIFFTEMNKLIEKMENAQSIEEVYSIFQQQLKELTKYI